MVPTGGAAYITALLDAVAAPSPRGEEVGKLLSPGPEMLYTVGNGTQHSS